MIVVARPHVARMRDGMRYDTRVRRAAASGVARNSSNERRAMAQLSTVHDDDLSHIKLIATDMDRTLLADDGTMPPQMHELIERMDRAGILLCAASGRPNYTLRDMFPDADRMALVADNGGAVFCRGELISTSLLAVDTYQELIAFTAADGRGVSTVCGIDACQIQKDERRYDDVFRRFYTQIDYIDRLEDLTCDVNKYTVFFPAGDSEDVFGSYLDAWSDRLAVTVGGKEWIDVMNKGVNKGVGLAQLCDHLGIALADTLALGDTYNDIEMLEAAGHGYVMANADEHMHAHANFMAPSNNERGVAQVIEAVLAAQGF